MAENPTKSVHTEDTFNHKKETRNMEEGEEKKNKEKKEEGERESSPTDMMLRSSSRPLLDVSRAAIQANSEDRNPTILLPNQSDDISHLALDIGGSLIKLVYFSRHEEDHSNDDKRKNSLKERLGISNGHRRKYPVLGGRLHFVKFETEKINDCLDFISSNHLHHSGPDFDHCFNNNTIIKVVGHTNLLISLKSDLELVLIKKIIRIQLSIYSNGFSLFPQSFPLGINCSTIATSGEGAYETPGNCKTLECPAYEVIHSQTEFEIRKYNTSKWMTTKPIVSMSYREASDIGFHKLFSYIDGNNTEGTKVEMTAPVLVDISNMTGPFCNSTFVMHFYLPKKHQANPPGSSVVSPVMWPSMKYSHMAIRRFGGMMEDNYVIAREAMNLMESLKGSEWEEAVMTAMTARMGGYSVAGYNSPFEIIGRVNEIVFPF